MPATPTNLLWRHFIKRHENKNNLHSVCKHCNRKLLTKNSTTSTLRSHLKRCHPDEYDNLIEAENARRLSLSNELITTAGENQLAARPDESDSKNDIFQISNQFSLRFESGLKDISKYQLNDRNQMALDKEVMIMLCLSDIPFSFLDTSGFKRFMNYVDPKYLLKSSDAFRGTQLPLLYTGVKNKVDQILKNDLMKVKGITFTTGTWMLNKNLYHTIAVSYISDEFELKSFLIGSFPSTIATTLVTLAHQIEKVIEPLKISSKTCRFFLSDNRFNVLTSMSKCKKIDFTFDCLECTLNSFFVIEAKNVVVKNLECVIEQCKQFVTKVQELLHVSHVAEFKQLCLKASDLKIRLEDITAPSEEKRFVTLCKQIDSIVKLRLALESIRISKSDESKVVNLIPSSENFDLLEAVYPLLENFRDVIVSLSSENQVTLTLVVPALFNLKAKMMEVARKESKASMFAVSLLNFLQMRLPNAGCFIMIYAAANYFHPYYRGALLHKFNALEYTKKWIIAENDTADEDSRSFSSSCFSRLATTAADQFACDFFHGVEVKKLKCPLEEEMDVYEALPRPHKSDMDILVWWMTHCSLMPNLSNISKKYLCIPAACDHTSSGCTSSQLESYQEDMVLYCKKNIQKFDSQHFKDLEVPKETVTSCDSDLMESITVELKNDPDDDV